MKDIFTNLYNKVIGFFQAEKGDSSKVIASNRLKLVLMHDRTNLDTFTMQKMREQLIKVISKYIEIDQEALDLNLEGEGDAIALMLNIPVIRARTMEEIEAIEKAEEEEMAQKALDANEESKDDETENLSDDCEIQEDDTENEENNENDESNDCEEQNESDKENTKADKKLKSKQPQN